MEAPMSKQIRRLISNIKTGRELIKQIREKNRRGLGRKFNIKLDGELYEVKKLGK